MYGVFKAVMLSLGSDKPGKRTVHGLKCHLEKTHKELFAEYTTKLNVKLDEHSTAKLERMIH